MVSLFAIFLFCSAGSGGSGCSCSQGEEEGFLMFMDVLSWIVYGGAAVVFALLAAFVASNKRERVTFIVGALVLVGCMVAAVVLDGGDNSFYIFILAGLTFSAVGFSTSPPRPVGRT